MKTVSMLQFRKDSASVLEALKKGVRIILTYRGNPVAYVQPFDNKPSVENDPINDLASYAVDCPLENPLKHDQIDKLIYG